MRHFVFTLVPLLLVAACADQPASPTAPTEADNLQASRGGIVHRVSVGGPDICSSPQVGSKPGCDANFSLIAIEYADGSVTGQWTDQYGPADGLHAVIDCLKVGPHPNLPGRLEAWVGGVVTRPANQAGHRIITRMRDNATSANERPDAIGRGIVDPEEEGFSSNCQDEPAIGFGQLIEGQVTIW